MGGMERLVASGQGSTTVGRSASAESAASKVSATLLAANFVHFMVVKRVTWGQKKQTKRKTSDCG